MNLFKRRDIIHYRQLSDPRCNRRFEAEQFLFMQLFEQTCIDFAVTGKCALILGGTFQLLAAPPGGFAQPNLVVKRET
jgi:hypothetical protein